MDFSSIDFRLHAVQRMYERGITTIDVKEVIKHGKIIEQYLDDKPFPNYLISGFINGKSLHVVVELIKSCSTCFSVLYIYFIF